MRKLTFSLLMLTLLATMGVGRLVDYVYSRYGSSSSAEHASAQERIKSLGHKLAQTIDSVTNRDELIAAWNSSEQYRIDIVALDNFAISDSLINNVKRGEPLVLEGNSSLSFNYYLPSTGELLVLKAPPLEIEEASRGIRLVFTGSFYLSLLVVFFAWAYPLTRRLSALGRTAKAFGEGELHRRVNVSSISYISAIEDEFNHMAQRIEDLIDDVKVLSSSMSHEMRAPLAKIRFGIDALQEENDASVRREYEERIGTTVDEMTRMVEATLYYARLNYKMADADRRDLDLAALVGGCVAKTANESRKVVYENPGGGYWVCGDPLCLEILVDNLLGNAIKYSRAHVQVQLIRRQNHILLSIADDGEGVDLTKKEALFMPFVRNVRKGEAAGGFGIGLAIARRIASWHRAQLDVEQSSALGGAEFTVVFSPSP